MKKNKNEAVRNTSAKPEKTESVSGSNTPSEKEQNNSIEEREFPFKKVLYGYNPEEVASFINELNKAHEISSKHHESKLSSLKEELAFSNRERDCYIRKCKEYQAKINENNNPDEDKSAEYKAIIIRLTENIKALKDENEALRNAPAPQPVAVSEQSAKNDADLEIRSKELEETKLILTSKEKEIEELKSLLAAKEKELEAKYVFIREKEEKANATAAENAALKQSLSEAEMRNSVMTRHVAECEEEILNLKEINKHLVFENAEKINMLESEHTKNKLEFQKELKLYGYYVDRAEIALAELTKQMAQIKQSIENTEI